MKKMKKNEIKLVIIGLVTLLFTSCATHQGLMQNSASLSSANFSYVKQQIQGKASATYIFGIGGLGKKTLVDNAKQRMIKSNLNLLSSNQALANITVNFKTSYYLLFMNVGCTVTADVVQFK